MSRLVYLSPLPWGDFAQRPHKFVEWQHAAHGGRVLWLEPYPSRLPKLADLRRLRGSHAKPGQAVPPWLDLVRVPALPVEPLPGGTLVNSVLWRDVLRRVVEFAAQGPCELVLGKPSALGLQIMRAARFTRTTYDAMDDFPAFHGGLSGISIAELERHTAAVVDVVQASSSPLQEKFSRMGVQRVHLVRNACDPRSLPAIKMLADARDPSVIGYVGTLAGWFDWDLLAALARGNPDKRFVLIGPLMTALPAGLPANVELRPACAHPEAMQQMARFGVGLIPFRCNTLTASVDPVKYYEYRALGIPVISTPFGEMPDHAREDPGVFMMDDASDPSALLQQASTSMVQPQWVEEFRAANSWAVRFAAELKPQG